MSENDNHYVPALRFRQLTRFYDPVLRAALKEDRFKHLLVEHARLKPGFRVLDVGCGTGTLTIMLKEACPSATIVGIDGDSEVLAIARRKADQADYKIELHEGLAYEPPPHPSFQPGSFDRIVSSLVFHHLTTDHKQRTLQQLRTLLKPGGELHIADWGKPQNALMRMAFLGVQCLDGFATTSDNVQGRLPDLIREAGFIEIEETHREMTLFGTLSLYEGTK